MFEIDFDRYRLVDLSYEVIPGQDGDRPFDIVRGYLADNTFKYDITRTHTHVGTHVEFPAHFFEGGKSVMDFPLDYFMGRAVLLPVRLPGGSLEISPDYMEASIGDIIKPGDIVICRNDTAKGVKDTSKLPYFSVDTTSWFLDHKVRIIGIDWGRIGLDVPSTREFHRVLMEKGVLFIEFLAGLDELKKREFYFMALPFRVRGIDSSWARAVAIEDV